MRLLPLLLLFSVSLATAADSRLQQNIERVARSVNARLLEDAIARIGELIAIEFAVDR